MSSYLYIGVTILLWGSSAAVIKLLIGDLDNLQLIFCTFPFSILSLFLIVLFQKKLPLLKNYSKNDYIKMIGMGALGCLLYDLFFFGAFMHTSAQEAFIVNYLWPIMVMIFSVILLNEKLTILKTLGLLISFLGIIFVTTKGELSSFSFSNITGDVLALLGAVSYGLFSVLGKKYKYETFTSMLIFYTSGFLLFLPIFFLFSSIPTISLQQLGGLLWVGIMTNSLAYVFWFKALENGDTAKISNLIFLTPFVSLVYIFFLTGEEILWSSVLGLLLIVSGILVQFLKKS